MPGQTAISFQIMNIQWERMKSVTTHPQACRGPLEEKTKTNKNPPPFYQLCPNKINTFLRISKLGKILDQDSLHPFPYVFHAYFIQPRCWTVGNLLLKTVPTIFFCKMKRGRLLYQPYPKILNILLNMLRYLSIKFLCVNPLGLTCKREGILSEKQRCFS